MPSLIIVQTDTQIRDPDPWRLLLLRCKNVLVISGKNISLNPEHHGPTRGLYVYTIHMFAADSPHVITFGYASWGWGGGLIELDRILHANINQITILGKVFII